MNVQVDDWGVKQMKIKWGTCNTQAKPIWLNLELAKLERSHGERFVALMNKFMPNWRFYKDELNRSTLGDY